MVGVNWDCIFERLYIIKSANIHDGNYLIGYWADIGEVSIEYIRLSSYVANEMYKGYKSLKLFNKLRLNYGIGFNEFNKNTLRSILTCNKVGNISTVMTIINSAQNNMYTKIW